MKKLVFLAGVSLGVLLPSCTAPTSTSMSTGERPLAITWTNTWTHTWADAWTDSWYARVNLQPGSNKTLQVRGKVTVKTGGWKVRLEKRIPQELNSRILALQLITIRPSRDLPESLVIHEPSYNLPGAGQKFQRVYVYDEDTLVANPKVEIMR